MIDIVLFEHSILEKILLYDKNYVVIEFNKILPKTVLYFFKYRKGLRFAYCLAFLERWRPKIVITFLPNNRVFHQVGEYYKAKFYALQNGVYFDHEYFDFPLKNYLCFGQRDADLNKTGTPIGSIKLSYYNNFLRDKDRKAEYDICLISQWNNIIYEEFHKLCLWVKGHVKEHNLSFCVASCANDRKERKREREYLKGIFGDVHISDKTDFSTYELMDKSKKVVSAFSTVGYEARRLAIPTVISKPVTKNDDDTDYMVAPIDTWNYMRELIK